MNDVWTADELDAGMTVPEAAIEIGCSRNTIYYRLKKLGIERRTRDFFLRREEVDLLRTLITPRGRL